MDIDDLKKALDGLTGGKGIVTDLDGLKDMLRREAPPEVFFDQAVLLGRNCDAQIVKGRVLSSDHRCQARISIDFDIDISNDDSEVAGVEDNLKKIMSFVASFAQSLHKAEVRLLNHKLDSMKKELKDDPEAGDLAQATSVLARHPMPSAEAFVDLFEQMPHLLHFAQDVLMVEDELLEPPEKLHVMHEFFNGLYGLMEDSKAGLRTAVATMENKKRDEEDELKRMDEIPSIDHPAEESEGGPVEPVGDGINELPPVEPTDT